MTPAQKNIQLLLVEDNMGDYLLTQEAMKDCGFRHHLHHAIDGVEALKFLNKEAPYQQAVSPDIILLDLNLPKKDGLEVLHSIKTSQHLKKIPVIVLTTSYSDTDIDAAYNLHANAYIPKPLDYDDFVTIIQIIEQFWIHVVKLPNHP